jgi:hypothetical protein
MECRLSPAEASLPANAAVLMNTDPFASKLAPTGTDMELAAWYDEVIEQR